MWPALFRWLFSTSFEPDFVTRYTLTGALEAGPPCRPLRGPGAAWRSPASVDGVSSLTMVPVAVACATVTLLSATRDGPSCVVGLADHVGGHGTLATPVVLPAGMVTLPVVAVKSLPDVAVPLEVENRTVTGVVAFWLGARGEGTGGAVVAPCETFVSLIDSVGLAAGVVPPVVPGAGGAAGRAGGVGTTAAGSRSKSVAVFEEPVALSTLAMVRSSTKY